MCGCSCCCKCVETLNSKEKIFLAIFDAINTVRYPCLSLHLNLCFMSCAVQRSQNQRASFLFPDCSKSLAAASHIKEIRDKNVVNVSICLYNDMT